MSPQPTSPPNLPSPQSRSAVDAWAAVAVAVAAVAGIFVLVVAGLIAADFTRRTGKDPMESEEFLALKTRLAKAPDDNDLKEQLRELDLRLRQNYFRHRAMAAHGAWLLLAGLGVFLAASRVAATFWRKLPSPRQQELPQDVEAQWTRIGRWSVAGLAVLLVGLAIALGAVVSSPLDNRDLLAVHTNLQAETPRPENPDTLAPDKPTPEEPAPDKPAPEEPARHKPVPEKPAGVAPKPGAADLPSKEEFAKSWPQFRGPAGLNISAYDNVPTKWDTAKGENIAWKAEVPLEGFSSPIVWGDRVFLTGGSETQREVYCFGTADGKLLWRKELPSTLPKGGEPLKAEFSGFAAPTPATDGRRVYVWFANGDLGALDFAGNVVWAKSLGLPKNNNYGHATSLLTWRHLLIVQFDQGEGKTESNLLALDGPTGNKAWETPRPVPTSWASPIVIDLKGREQIVTCASPWVIAYEPADGKEIWRSNTLRQDVGPSPAFADGIVYVGNQAPCVAAIRPDGQGDVTATHVLWKGEDNLPDTCSPLVTPQHLFVLTSEGNLTCYDAKKGKNLWVHDFESVTFKASPALVGKLIYLISDKGKAWVVEPGPTGAKVVSESVIDEDCSASPAFQDGRMYLRAKKYLYCVGKK